MSPAMSYQFNLVQTKHWVCFCWHFLSTHFSSWLLSGSVGVKQLSQAQGWLFTPLHGVGVWGPIFTITLQLLRSCYQAEDFAFIKIASTRTLTRCKFSTFFLKLYSRCNIPHHHHKKWFECKAHRAGLLEDETKVNHDREIIRAIITV